MATEAGVLPGGCVGESRPGAGLETVIRVSLRPLISQEVCHDESGLRPSREVKSNQGGKVQVRRRFERKCRFSCRQKSFNLKAAPKGRRGRAPLFLFIATALTSEEAVLDSAKLFELEEALNRMNRLKVHL